MPDTIRFSETLEPSVYEIIETIRKMALEGVLASQTMRQRLRTWSAFRRLG
jgi:hypothetical protein